MFQFRFTGANGVSWLLDINMVKVILNAPKTTEGSVDRDMVNELYFFGEKLLYDDDDDDDYDYF